MEEVKLARQSVGSWFVMPCIRVRAADGWGGATETLQIPDVDSSG